jgi:hypothetical protein
MPDVAGSSPVGRPIIPAISRLRAFGLAIAALEEYYAAS